jgi:hypothetical protein
MMGEVLSLIFMQVIYLDATRWPDWLVSNHHLFLQNNERAFYGHGMLAGTMSNIN